MAMTDSDRTPGAFPAKRKSTFSIFRAIVLVAIAGAAVLLVDARSRSLLFNTFRLTAGALAVAIPIGAFLGFVLARTDIWGRRTAGVFVGSLLLVPLYLVAAAWQSGFGIEGWQTALQTGEIREPWLDGWRGAIWVHGCAGVPWVALFVGLAARTIPRQWEELALLDLSAAGVFCRVTLRVVLPAVFLGALWVAITTMTEMSVTDLFAVRTYAEELYVDLNLGSWNAVMGTGATETGEAPALAGMLLTVIGALAAMMLARGAMVVPQNTRHDRPLVFELGAGRTWLSLGAWTVVSVLVLLPLFSLIYKAGAFVDADETGYQRGWSAWKALATTVTSPADHSAELTWSLLMAAGTVCVTLLFAIPLAYASRISRIAGGIVLVLVVVGLAVPGPVVALWLTSASSAPAWSWLYDFYDRTIFLPVLAQSLRAFPLTYFLLWHALRTVPQAMVEAASLDGVGPFRCMMLVVRQRSMAVTLAGFAASLISLGELSATILVVPPGFMPLSVHIFQLLHYNVQDQVAAITLMLILFHAIFTFALLAIGRRVFRIS
jgi:iron(III) transport system permease protein